VVVGNASTVQAAAKPVAPAPSGKTWANASFRLEIDTASGSMVSIVHPRDPSAMNWISGPANAPWQPRSSQWGLGYADIGSAYLHRGRWESPLATTQTGIATLDTVYQVGPLKVEVTRTLDGAALHERYALTNTGTEVLPVAHKGKAGCAIALPFNDHYTSAAEVLEHRCHTHVWAGGTTSWVATLRMGGRAPHLGLVVTEGGWSGYSIAGRDEITSSNTRGTFLVHPDIAGLQPGATRTVAWTLFWHTGWDDFFAQCAQRSSTFVKLDAPRHTAYVGESVAIEGRGRNLAGAGMTVNGQPLTLTAAAGGVATTWTPRAPGEATCVLTTPSGVNTRILLNAVPPLDDLIAARVRFIVKRQQVDRPGDVLDGALLVYDNQADVQVRAGGRSDLNEGRERLGMGVLLARWLRLQPGRDPAALAALLKYHGFVVQRLQRADGYVRNAVDVDRPRLYNWPWVAQLHLEVARLTGSETAMDMFVRTIDSYYANDGLSFYPIGLPVYDGLNALKAAGRHNDHQRLLQMFTRHAEKFAARGLDYPHSEVNFEQSIVAPATLLLLELHRATGERRWFDAALPHLALLELFNGRQPDHHLHEVAIRHWDGYWFGKRQLWGDTFPHYWSTLTALAFDHYAKAGGERQYASRADTIVRNNLSLFTPEGRGSAAFVYPVTVNGQKAHLADPYANDQDWALVHALQMREA